MQKKKSRVLFITQTAALLALLIAAQAATKPLGQLVTGSCVNCILAVSAMLCGWQSGLIVAAISPFMAFLMGIGPAFFPLTPFIALGNAVYALLMCLPVGRSRRWVAALIASGAKFLTLWLCIVQGVCRFADLKPKQIETFSAMFSLPQLTTALIGSAAAILIVPLVKKALTNHNGGTQP